MPERIQLSRAKGWRKPEGAINVARPSRWGNRYTISRGKDACADWGIYISYDHGKVLRTQITDMATARALAVDMFRTELLAECDDEGVTPAEMCAPLHGHDLACWCPLVDTSGGRVPCHADVLLELANPGWTP